MVASPPPLRRRGERSIFDEFHQTIFWNKVWLSMCKFWVKKSWLVAINCWFSSEHPPNAPKKRKNQFVVYGFLSEKRFFWCQFLGAKKVDFLFCQSSSLHWRFFRQKSNSRGGFGGSGFRVRWCCIPFWVKSLYTLDSHEQKICR